MAKRIPLFQRQLPCYCKGEEIMNMVTHIVGGGLSIIGTFLCFFRVKLSLPTLTGVTIYGICLISLYTFSSVYHGLRPGTGKKVMQIMDHCGIYFLIAGTYTPILLIAFLPQYPAICWGLLALQWVCTAVAVTFTAIDLRKYRVFSMILYICMGWAILPFLEQTMELMTNTGFYLLLSGGIAYTLGAILYGIGSKKPWFHSVFHIFVVLGSLLQFLSIYLFVL